VSVVVSPRQAGRDQGGRVGGRRQPASQPGCRQGQQLVSWRPVLVERKELQSLQSERRALFSRIDEAAAEARALRGEVQSREDQVSRARVSAAQQQE
jgi:hypothetical protein